MRKLIVLTVLSLAGSLAYAGVAPFIGVRVLVANSAFTASAAPQAQTPRPIRTLPGLEEIRFWIGGFGANFPFGPNDPTLNARLNVLDNSTNDIRPVAVPGGLDAYDIFYSNADGTLNADGAYVTVEAVSNSRAQGAGGGNLAEIGLRFSGSATFEYGNVVASYVALGENADPGSVFNAIDENTSTFTRLGNTGSAVNPSQRLRITIGFESSTGPATTPALSIDDLEIEEGDDTHTIEVPVTLSARSISEVRVNYATAPDSANADRFDCDDYCGVSGTLVFPPGVVSLPIRISILGDRDEEADESFLINLSNPVNAQIRRAQGRVVILNDDFSSIDQPNSDSFRAVQGERVTSTIHISNDGIIKSARIRVVVEGAFEGRFSLTSPDGSTVALESGIVHVAEFSGIRCGGETFSLGLAFSNHRLSGRWTLVIDNIVGTGTLDCWDLVFEYAGTGVGLTSRGTEHIFAPTKIEARVVDGQAINGARVTFLVSSETGDIQNISAEVPTDTNGLAEFVYTRTQVGRDRITARVTINGRPFGDSFGEARTFLTWQQGTQCPIETMTGAAYGGDSTLNMTRGFRDQVLARTPRGKSYTEAYYKFSSEAVRVMMFNPMLMIRSRETIERYKPVIQSMLNGEQVTLTHGDLDEIDGFLNSFAAKGSPGLQQAIRGACKDLRDPQVHAEFGITVIDGPKRELPGLPLDTMKHTGGLAVLLGFCVAFVFCFAPGRGKNARIKARRLICLMLAMLLSGGQWSVAGGQSRGGRKSGRRPGARGQSKNNSRRLPIAFEANQGQIDSQVKFLSRGNGCNFFLKPTEAALRLRIADCGSRIEDAGFVQRPANLRPEISGSDTSAPTNPHSAIRNPQSAELRMQLVGANRASRMIGLDELPAKTNYFIGKDSARWRANVPTYGKVRCEQVYPGVDMVYYGNQRELEYDFEVTPGADPGAVKLMFDGAERIRIDKNGDLVLTTASGDVRQRKPVTYQEASGTRQIIPSRFVMFGNQTSIRNRQSAIRSQEVGFEFGSYDRNRPLIIDPVLAYSTYLGGSGDDEGNAITVDSSGNVYVVGFTDSVNFPTASASQPTLGGGQQDVFVAKLNPSGTQLIYSTYLGGNGQDNGSGIAVDSAGNAYITGFTSSTNFPVRNAMQPTKNGPFNAFVAKLDSTGSLVYSTHLGGSAGDYGSSIAVDSFGNVYVAGVATSLNFPMVNALQRSNGGGADVYVAKLNQSGTQLVYSTYLGGTGNDGATSIAVDSAGNVYLTGVTSSSNFRTMNPLQASHGGGMFDAFVAKVNPPGNQLIYSTYLGGSGEDRAFRIALDSAGNAYVTGDTDSTNFPTVNALQRVIGGSVDAFIAKLNPSGTALVYSTYIGGSGIDGATAIAVDASGSTYVTGFTGSTNFPTISPVQQASGGGSFDAFVAKLNPSGTALDYSTYLGGAGIDAGFGIAVDPSGNVYVMGQTDSTGFPTASPLQPTNGGGSSDVFIAKIAPTVASGPHITGASVSGKKLFVFGSGFDSGAKVLLNGESQKTSNDDQNPATALIAKKSGNKITPGQTATLQVRNVDGTLSNQFSFTR